MDKLRLHKEEMPAYLDKEVLSADRDKFGHTHLADALRGLIENEKHRPPYSVGLLGKWGTGKSTVKEIYLHDLKNDEIKNGDGTKRRDRVYTITFNAWKYGGETDIRKSLFRHIFLKIGGKHEEADRHLFKTVESTEFQRKPFSEICTEFTDHVPGLLIVGFFVLLFSALVTLIAWAFGSEDPFTVSIGLLTSAGVVAWLVQKFFSNLMLLSARKPMHITSPPSQTIEEFESLFLAQMKKFKKGGICSDKGKNVQQIVVFVDDLDRLTADEMVSGLDGIRSLIEMASHEMPDDTGIVFVISCDEERVADVLSKRRAYGELSANVSNIQDARRYLDRIFQFRLEIPPFPKRDMRNFVLSLVETEYPALQADLEQRKIDNTELVDRMIHPAVQSPRNAIQILNLFAQSWWLGVLREYKAVGSENPGGLGEGVVTGHPLTLAVVCVIRTDFPDFHQALQRNPRIFDYFIDRFIRPEPLQALPTEIHEELAVFATKQPEKNRWEVKPQHRGLRQFMSYTQDVRRPYSLQPFLALSQDSVSRKHGDKAVPIEEALRTSDSIALLDAVGLTGSTEPLPPDFGTLLADLIDDLLTETPTIQDNVAFTVAQLDQRIPEKDKRRVLGFIIRRAGGSGDLRWRVGPSKLQTLASYAEKEELQVLGRSLIEDLVSDETKVLLPSLERPSLSEGRNLTEITASMILEIMEKTELPPIASQQFGDWLLNRSVKISGQSDQIPLTWLEEKLLAHEDIILPMIRNDYPHIIAEELSREEPEQLDLAIITDRASRVFDYFFEQGTQTRVKLWDYLKSFATLRQSSLVALAFSKFSQWYNDVDTDSADDIFEALGTRLAKNEEDAGTWPLDDEEETLRDIFVDLAEALQSFSNDGISNMIHLAQGWSNTSLRSGSAARIYSVIQEVDFEQWVTLSTQWTERLFTDLPEACQEILIAAANQKDAPEEMRMELASSIASLCSPIEFDNHKIASLSRILCLLDKSLLHASPFAEQIEEFVNDTIMLITQSPDNSAVLKVRTLGDNLDKLPVEKAHQLLDSLSDIQWDIVPSVYKEFSEKWPMPASEGGIDFAAQNLFDVGIDAFDNLEQSEEGVQLLKSLDNLQRRARLDQEDNQGRLVHRACGFWSYAPETAENIVGQYPDTRRTPELLSGLAEKVSEISTGDDDDRERLLEFLLCEVGRANAEDIQKVTTRLLSERPQEIDGLPNPVLALWVAAVSRLDPQILVDTLVSDEYINDDQAVHLYNHVLNKLEHISDEHFFEIFRETLSTADGREKTADVVVRSIGNVADRLLISDGQKRRLCEAALSVFSEIPNRERKANLAKVCTPFGLKNVIVDGEYKNHMSEDDLEIIEGFTGKISKKGIFGRDLEK